MNIYMEQIHHVKTVHLKQDREESILDGIKHYSSLLIDKDNSNDCRILMSPVDTGSISPRRFNTDFLINSYYSFIAKTQQCLQQPIKRLYYLYKSK